MNGVSTRQLIVLIAAVTVFAAGLAWFLQRAELTNLHSEIKGYLGRHDAFRAWEKEQGPE